MDLEIVAEFTKRVDPDFTIIDGNIAAYQEWISPANNPYAGMRHKTTGKAHGVIRVVMLTPG